MGNDASGTLRGLMVLDMGIGMAAAMVARFLADAGATVLRMPADGVDPAGSIYRTHEQWRRHSRSVDAPIDAMLDDADLCIVGGEDFPGLPAGPSPGALAKAHPRLIVVEIGGYPPGIGHDGRPAVDLLVQARTGLVFEHYSDRPLAMAFEPATIGAALHAVAGAFAALYERELSGHGQVVSTSLFEGALTYGAYFWAHTDVVTPQSSFVIPKDPRPLILPCRDGLYIHIVLGAAGSKARLYRVLGIDEPLDPADSGLPSLSDPPSKFFGEVDRIAAHVARFDRPALLEAIWREGVPAEAVLEPAECWDGPQVRSRHIVVEEKDGSRRIGMPVDARFIDASAPSRESSAGQPLAGIRVVDFGAFVAGPYGSMILADLGADVIRIDAPTGDPNRASFLSFASANRTKRSVVLDLKSPADRDRARRLCGTADVVMNNFRTGVSTRLGVDAATLHREKPSLIVLENSAFGPTGPKAANAGFDPIMQAYCGLEARAGGKGNPPLMSRTVPADYTAGLLGAIAVLMALYNRARTGRGAELSVPLMNAGLFLGSDLIRHADGTVEGLPELNASQTGRRPAERLYQAADGWIAIAIRDKAAASALARVLDSPALGRRPLLEWGDVEESAIAAAIRTIATKQATAALEAAGIWVEECRPTAAEELLADPRAQQLGTVWEYHHPELGAAIHIGPLLRFSRSALSEPRRPPSLGEHSDEVLCELEKRAGVSESGARRSRDALESSGSSPT